MAESFARRVLRTLTSRPRAADGDRPRRGRGGAISYDPRLDGDADPGEVVWGEVAYEDRPDIVKDRPLLVVGRKDRATVLCLQLSSQTKRDGQPGWFALGSGAWDQEGRPSFVRLDRVIEMRADAIRREGAVLDPSRFRAVTGALRARGGRD